MHLRIEEDTIVTLLLFRTQNHPSKQFFYACWLRPITGCALRPAKETFFIMNIFMELIIWIQSNEQTDENDENKNKEPNAFERFTAAL